MFKSLKSRVRVVAIALTSLLLLGSAQSVSASPSVGVLGVTDGSNTFISFVDISGFTGNSLRSIAFKVQPKTGAKAAAIQGTYSSTYLRDHGYLNTSTGVVRVPVYGLYQSYTNQISISYNVNAGRKSLIVPIQTGEWANGCNDDYSNQNHFENPTNRVRLNFSYFMLKTWACGSHPVVMDIDGNVRWAGTAGDGEQGSSFFGNSMYLGAGSQLIKMELDGTNSVVGDYGSQGYYGFHHNIDFGKSGLLLDLHHDGDIEANIIEVSKSGALLKEWDLGAIIDQAMIAGGDDPSGFVNHSGGDWFHNNAATYWRQKNELVVSSRENFVIGIGYDDKKIKWILGDPDKAWYQYSSLRAFALRLPARDHPPIGNHAVSITSAGNLMLFDNGLASGYRWPYGSSRGYSSPRQYSINEVRKTASEVWSFERDQSIWSPICSSIYQDGDSYLIDYASDGSGIRLVGIDSQKRIAFDWQMPWTGYVHGWNALPIHIENLSY